MTCSAFFGEAAAWAEGDTPVPAPPPPPAGKVSDADPPAGGADVEEGVPPGGTTPGESTDTPLITDTDGSGTTPLIDDVTAENVTQRRFRRRLPVHGSFRMHYRLRATGDDSDSDLYQYLLLYAGDENRPGWSGSFHGRLTEDLDGRKDDTQFYVFDSITDTYGSRVNGRIYHAYVNYRPRRGILRQARLGRQFVEAGELFHVDGLSLEFQPRRSRRGLEIMGFGGVPAHIFESSIEGDFIGGMRVKARPWTGGEVEFDYARIEDETLYYGNEVNDLFSLSWRQRVSRCVGFWGQYQHLNGDPRQLRVHFDATEPVRDIFVRGSFHTIFETQNDLAFDIDPYFAVTRQLEPYWNADLAVSRGFGNHFFVEGGVTVRQLNDDGDEGRYNREFERYFLGVSTDHWPRRNVFLSLIGEHWQSNDEATSVSFEAEWRPSKRFRLQVGTDYDLYRFDLYTADERQYSRGYYVRVRWRPHRRWNLHLRLRLEDDEFDTYTTLRTGFDFDF